MNAMGHKMLHVHSDETGPNDRWSAEILSSGLTAGFALTDRVKGVQKGNGQAGSQWLMYSRNKAYRIKVTETILLCFERLLHTLQLMYYCALIYVSETRICRHKTDVELIV